MASLPMLQIRLKVNRKFNHYNVFELYRQYLKNGEIDIDGSKLSKSQVKRVEETGQQNQEQYQEFLQEVNKLEAPEAPDEPCTPTPPPVSPPPAAKPSSPVSPSPPPPFVLPVPVIPPIPPLPAVKDFLQPEIAYEENEDQTSGLVFWSERTQESKEEYIRSLTDALDELEASGVLKQWQNECPEQEPNYPRSTPITDAIASLDPNVPISWDEFFARIDSAGD